jgi:hypothetical protein
MLINCAAQLGPQCWSRFAIQLKHLGIELVKGCVLVRDGVLLVSSIGCTKLFLFSDEKDVERPSLEKDMEMVMNVFL